MITYAPYNSIAYPSSRWSKSSFSYGFSAPFPHPNFTGKETDCETGFSYFGARYYDPTLMTSFLSIDRYANKYPNLSPYHYCAWNPIIHVDPNGDSVIINGSQADRAVAQLQTTNMEITRSHTGTLYVDLHGNDVAKLSDNEKNIYDAINSQDINIHILAEKSSIDENNDHYCKVVDGDTQVKVICPYGGSNIGAYLSSDRTKVDCWNYVDMDMLDEKGYNQGVAHEISEALLIGQAAIKNGVNVPMAIQKRKDNPIMCNAHNRAIPASSTSGQEFGVKKW